MKTAKKALLLALCAVLLVVATVMGTLAYLKSTTQVVTNTMTAGKVEIVSLNESKVDVYGAVDSGADRVTANDYKLIPGHLYTKDPDITIKGGSEKAYVYVEVKNEIAAIESNENTIAAQLTANGWTALDGVSNVFYRIHPENQAADVTYNVFGSFKIASDAAVEDYVDKTIKIKGYAVQYDGFGDNAKAAWDAADFDMIDTVVNP